MNDPLSISMQRQIDDVCTRFEDACQYALTPNLRWPCLEEFLDKSEVAQRSVLLQELVYLDLFYRRKAGHHLTMSEYLERFEVLPDTWLEEAWSRIRREVLPESDQRTGDCTRDYATGDQSQTRSCADPTEEPVLDSEERYARVRLHATGGNGQVWIAHDRQLDRTVALKELRAETAKTIAVQERFFQEAHITGQLEHPGIPPIYELATDLKNQRHFYTMRFVNGRTLHEAAGSLHEQRPSGDLDWSELLKLLNAFVSVCNTIAYAHSCNVLHRDLKGQNVLLGNFGEVIVLDWGLAKTIDQSEPNRECSSVGESHSETDNIFLTSEGQVMGTPAYMAPEQAAGELEKIDRRTDVYGLAAMLYEILTGQPPFVGSSVESLLMSVLSEEPVPPRLYWADVPAPLEAACLQALSKDPNARIPSARELGQLVEQWQEIERKKAEENVRSANERLYRQQQALVSLTRSGLLVGDDLAATYRHMTRLASQTLHVDRVSIWFYTEDQRAICCEVLYELEADRHSSGILLDEDAYPSYFEALRTSEIIAVEDVRNDLRTKELAERYLIPLNIGSMMDAPIHLAGRLRGVVCHERVGPQRPWLPDEQLFGIALANLVAQALSQLG